MNERGDPTGRHHLAPDQHGDDAVESVRFELIAALCNDVAVYRVLWLLATGMNQEWCLRDLALPDAVDRVIGMGLVVAPEEELIAYQLTDAGRARIREWYFGIRHHRDEREFQAIWRAVTGR
ncbi:hypothetical protein JOF56_000855 [Kibdelosporangium banguiense]|uniref:Uncharacterized protein n=1 Tax=Kibdelosporangium banguiense TaxID=1365924 RepID=A0ABS4T7S5_9PSEU|nr:hypothetical protein [Kibdelosporangium banguiense]MBP2320470.1 hypothetical protein [Kibdelosporangium banguiense]